MAQPIARLSSLAALALGAALSAVAVPAAAHAQADRRPADACAALAGLRLGATTIDSATAVRDPRALPRASGIAADLPPFCRVVARVRQAPGSDIGIEVWLPLTAWAGVFHGTGNGGFGGALNSGYGAMAAGLRKGFASATTDTGTAPATSLDGDALIGQPRKWRDWGRLSTHVMTETGKSISAAFYGRQPDRSYYTGCSTGGQQGLIEALYYPRDYNGILVGAPVINRTWGHAAVAWDFAVANRTPGSVLSSAKLALLNKAALAECGGQGYGLASDPFIADALQCRFDPAVLTCKQAEGDQCLTPPEVRTARAFYSGPTSSAGKPLFYGWLPGSEVPGRFGWSFLQSPVNGGPAFGGLFKWVFGANWDWRTFDIDRDMPRVDALLGPVVNDAAHGSLAAFAARGGKLIVYHGLADTLVPPGQTVDFFRDQADRLGQERMQSAARLFLAPGMMHCGGGTGPDVLNSASGGQRPPIGGRDNDLFDALISWDRNHRAPASVVATKFDAAGNIAMQRPLCAYPRQARYNGSGPTNAASSFTCAAPRIR